MSERTRLGVLGWPVAHSRSPAMQNAALAAVGPGRRGATSCCRSRPELFEETVRALPAAGFRGANVTIPHKQRGARRSPTRRRERARAIGAANTLVFDERRGDPGRQHRCARADRVAAVLAGRSHARSCSAPAAARGRRCGRCCDAGAARGAGVEPHPGARSQAVRRSSERPPCDRPGPPTSARPLHVQPDWTVRAVFSSRFRSGPMTTVGTDAWLISSTQLPRRHLVQAARARSVAVVDGLELLVGQGALSFERFTGIAAPAATMRAAARRTR